MMILNKIRLARTIGTVVLIFLTGSVTSCYAQKSKPSVTATKVQISKLKAAVEAKTDSLKVHEAYIKAVGVNSPVLVAQYELWMKKYPKSAMVPYAIGKAYEDMESPNAKPYLLKAVAINPKFTEAWGGLWVDGERWGDFEKANEYLKKAADSDPFNATYAFYYAYSFKDKDKERYREMSLDVAKRFATRERGAQALYWLANSANDSSEKMEVFDLLKRSFNPEKYNWSLSGMYSYYDLLLDLDAEKAASLAQEMSKIKQDDTQTWVNYVKTSQNVIEIKKLIGQKKGTEALALIGETKLPGYFSFKNKMTLLKAKAIEISSNSGAAYDSLIVYFLKTPNLILRKGISDYGTQMGKNGKQIDADIWKSIDTGAKAATPFQLKNYLTSKMTSLSDYKGKVVLLTYWFPGCGPCRAEFLHFENVIRKFKGQAVDYVGINVVLNQNEYVIPFMKTTKFSFSPLEEVKGRIKGNLDNRDAAPANFIIDQEGRVVFSFFRTEANNEDELELMINLLLAGKKD